jgi:Flp pilus assembly protein TadG
MKSARDRGSVSLWLIIFAFAVLVLLGFVVDGGQYMNAREQAADIAQQAARAAVGDLSTGALRSGQQQLTLNPDACHNPGPAYTLVTEYAGKAATIQSGPQGCRVGWMTGPGSACTTGQPPPAGAVPCVMVTVRVTVLPALPIGVFGTFTAAVTEQASLDCGSQAEAEAC